VLSVSVTVTEDVKSRRRDSAPGWRRRTRIVYVALAGALVVYPGAAAIALTVVVCVTVIGPVYGGDAVVGMLPSWCSRSSPPTCCP